MDWFRRKFQLWRLSRMSEEEVGMVLAGKSHEEIIDLLGAEVANALQDFTEEFLAELAEEVGVPKEELRRYLIEKRASTDLIQKVGAVMDKWNRGERR